VDIRESQPSASEYLALFASTGWNREYRLSAEELNEAIFRSWCLITAYDQNKLVGTGRVISDGVFDAFIVDGIVRARSRTRLHRPLGHLQALQCAGCLGLQERANHTILFAEQKRHIHGVENFWNQAKGSSDKYLVHSLSG